MNFAQWWRFGAALLMLALVSACTNVPGGSTNPFRQGSVYSHLPHPEPENLRVLSSGELLYER